MPNTLFVVDDSATMRRVFELTFAGEDVTVVTHDGADGVVAKVKEARPQAVIVDVALGGQKAGYDVVRTLRSEAGLGAAPIYLLYSEHSPLDETAARACGAVGAIVKPFETQVLIDKVRQALAAGARGTVTATTGNVTAPFGNPQATPAPIGAIPPAPARPAETAAFTAPRPGGLLGTTPAKAPTAPTPVARPATPAASPLRAPPPPLPGGTAPTPVSAPRPSPVAAVPTAQATVVSPVAPPPRAPSIDDELTFEPPPADKPAAPAAHAEKPAADALTATVAHAVEQRVSGLGLTPAQVEAVTALTRDVVERVVWEVVPQLAEVMIREELKRLTAD